MRIRSVLFILLISSLYAKGQILPANILDQIKGENPKQQAITLDSIAIALRNENIRLSLSISRYNLEHCKKYKLPITLVKTYLGISRTYRGKGLYDSALMYIDSAKNFAFTYKVHEQYGNVFDYEGLVYMRMGDYKKATESFYESISWSEKEKDSIKIHDAFNHLGSVAFYRFDYKTAGNLYKKSLLYIPANANKRTRISLIDNIGLCYSNRNMPDSALIFQKEAVTALEELNDSSLLAESYVNIASTYLLLKNYKEAKPYLEKALAIDIALNYEYGQIIANTNIGRLYLGTKQADKAIAPLEKAYLLANKLKLPAQIKETSSTLAEAFETIGEYRKAAYYLRQLANVMQTIYAEENTKSINELSTKYEIEKKLQQIQLLTKDSELQQQTIRNDRYMLIIYGAIAFLFLLLSVLFIYRFRKKKKDNKLLQEKNDAIALQKTKIEEQKEELQHKNTEITDSINYAKRIQASVIPSDTLVSSLLPDSFIYFRPKDIVSGDFYWLAEKNNFIYFAVADCTGHGVPGAMMSMLGTSLLNQIISSDQIKLPADVLKELHYQVVRSLNEDMERRDSKDGMDIALIMIDRVSKKVFYSGAGRPLYIVKNGTLQNIRGDKYSIGGIFDAKTISFETHEFSIDTSTTLYLFSDGVPDQFGGPKGKKFMTKQLQEIVENMTVLSMHEQQLQFKQSFESWKKDVEQTDDVTLAGIRFT